MVLMGINRIVVTSGRISRRMGFFIDASDTARAESASQFDASHEHDRRAAGFLAGDVESKTSRRVRVLAEEGLDATRSTSRRT